jgi:hypothetical protein
MLTKRNQQLILLCTHFFQVLFQSYFFLSFSQFICQPKGRFCHSHRVSPTKWCNHHKAKNDTSFVFKFKLESRLFISQTHTHIHTRTHTHTHTTIHTQTLAHILTHTFIQIYTHSLLHINSFFSSPHIHAHTHIHLSLSFALTLSSAQSHTHTHHLSCLTHTLLHTHSFTHTHTFTHATVFFVTFLSLTDDPSDVSFEKIPWAKNENVDVNLCVKPCREIYKDLKCQIWITLFWENTKSILLFKTL